MIKIINLNEIYSLVLYDFPLYCVKNDSLVLIEAID